MRRSEVRIQCAECSRAAWDRVDHCDPAICHRADGNDEMVEDVDGLHDPARHSLADLPDAYLRVQGNLQWRTVRDRHWDSAGMERR